MARLTSATSAIRSHTSTREGPDENGGGHRGSSGDRRKRFGTARSAAAGGNQANRPATTRSQRARKHTHPGEEIIYVIEGTLEYQIDGKPSTVKAGDVLFVPAGTVHSAKNIGSSNGAELATYVVEKGKPLITVVK